MDTVPPIHHVTKTLHRTQYPAIDPTSPANSAAGKTVVVSGGATGIGFAIARGFAAAGASTVVLLARRPAVLEESAAKLRAEFGASGTQVWSRAVDLKDGESVAATFDDVRKKLSRGGANGSSGEREGDVDVLVLSAAYIEEGLPVLSYTQDSLRDSFETNALGNLNAVRAFLGPEAVSMPIADFSGVVKVKGAAAAQAGRKTGEKVVLDVSSVAAHITLQTQSMYGASKLAFSYMMRHLQREIDQVGGMRIRVHSFHPGAIFTQSVLNAGLNEDSFPWDDESLPAGFTVWLASPAATFLKGRFLHSAWDVNELLDIREQIEQDEELGRIALKTKP